MFISTEFTCICIVYIHIYIVYKMFFIVTIAGITVDTTWVLLRFFHDAGATEEPTVIQMKKEQYRQELLRQIAEQRDNKLKYWRLIFKPFISKPLNRTLWQYLLLNCFPREKQMEVAATGATDPKKEVTEKALKTFTQSKMFLGWDHYISLSPVFIIDKFIFNIYIN